MENENQTSDHAKALSSLGASKGGENRAKNLSSEDRSEIARQAAEARWGNAIPKATHIGRIAISDREITCAVLENGERVLTQETFLTAIGRAAKAKAGTGSTSMVDGLPPFLSAENLKPFIDDELRQSTTPIVFRTITGGRAFGYKAILLPMVCEAYLKARDAGTAHPSQEKVVQVCDILMRGLARVGIIALVDEATGYQEQRAKDELSKILEAYIAPELMPWTKMFSDEFFRQVYRIHDWEYKPGCAKRPGYVGHFINNYIYAQLPPGVLEELKKLNPVTEKGYRKHRHFQLLSENTGNPHLDKQISSVTMLMRISDSKDDFKRNFEKAFLNIEQERLPLVIDVKAEPTKD